MASVVALDAGTRGARGWQALSAPHRRFLVVDELVGGAVVSFFVNLVLGFIFFYFTQPVVPLYGFSSIAADTLGMAIMLPAFTALGARIVVDRAVASGKLEALRDVPSTRWLRTAGWLRGTWVGVACAGVIVPVLVVVMRKLGHAQLPFWHFLWLKGALAALIGAVVTPLLGWWALQDASRLADRRSSVPGDGKLARLRRALDPFGRI